MRIDHAGPGSLEAEECLVIKFPGLETCEIEELRNAALNAQKWEHQQIDALFSDFDTLRRELSL